jgi:uncharacterized protein HemX
VPHQIFTTTSTDSPTPTPSASPTPTPSTSATPTPTVYSTLTPVPANPEDPEDTSIGPGLTAFLIVVALGIALFFLLRSMVHHINKVPATFDTDEEADSAPEAEAAADADSEADSTPQNPPA